MNARHSAKSSEWYTPSIYVEAAREVMGSIDLDPASCAEANEVVRASTYYTAEQDGLDYFWQGNVFVNPPGGKNEKGSLVRQFWSELCAQYAKRQVKQAVWIGYSLEQLQTLQTAYRGHYCGLTPMNFPMCVPSKRIAFIGKGDSPSHGNYITYIGPHVDRFEQVFSQFGQVRL